MPAKARLFQVLADALIPLLGFYLWDWSLYFIFLFFIADELVDECFMFLKSRKIIAIQNNSRLEWFKNVFYSFSLLMGEIFLFHVLVYLFNQDICFPKEILDFLSYKDMGIQQGFILIPLLIVVGLQRYKFEFILPEMYRKVKLANFWKEHRIKQYYLLAFTGISVGICSLGVRNDQVFLWLFIIAIASVDLIKTKTTR